MNTPDFDATIERREAFSVASLLSLTDIVRGVDAPRSLLFARINWANLQGASRAIGAPAPRVARATYTREARRVQRQRQLERRGGVSCFLRALSSL